MPCFRTLRGHILYVDCSCQGHAWLKDDEATQCKQCQKEFSISRRKVRSSCTTFLLVYIHFSPAFMSTLCLCCSTIAETVATSTATVAPVTSWPCRPTPDLCGCATCATPSCCRGAPPQLPDKTVNSFVTTHTHPLFSTMRLLMTTVIKSYVCDLVFPFCWCLKFRDVSILVLSQP